MSIRSVPDGLSAGAQSIASDKMSEDANQRLIVVHAVVTGLAPLIPFLVKSYFHRAVVSEPCTRSLDKPQRGRHPHSPTTIRVAAVSADRVALAEEKREMEDVITGLQNPIQVCRSYYFDYLRGGWRRSFALIGFLPNHSVTLKESAR